MWSQQFMKKVAVTIKRGFALPQKELTVFNVDPLEYWSFISSFQNSIEANATSESEKLMYLLQYTSGAAKDSIKCCLVLDPSIGYQRARKLLEERFGQPFTIAYEHVTPEAFWVLEERRGGKGEPYAIRISGHWLGTHGLNDKCSR